MPFQNIVGNINFLTGSMLFLHKSNYFHLKKKVLTNIILRCLSKVMFLELFTNQISDAD